MAVFLRKSGFFVAPACLLRVLACACFPSFSRLEKVPKRTPPPRQETTCLLPRPFAPARVGRQVTVEVVSVTTCSRLAGYCLPSVPVTDSGAEVPHVPLTAETVLPSTPHNSATARLDSLGNSASARPRVEQPPRKTAVNSPRTPRTPDLCRNPARTVNRQERRPSAY